MTGEFAVDDLVIEWRHNKRRKRNVGFVFQPGGRLILDAPPRTRPAELEAMVREHMRWIRHRLRAARDAAPEHPPLTIEAGALLPYLGDTLHLRWARGARKSVVRTGNVLQVTSREETMLRDQVRDWYKSEGVELFSRLLDGWRDLPWLAGRDVAWRQRFMKSQWGSCSARGDISLNTHLVKVPEPLVDYVLLHELCHIKVMDHSRRFYALMDAHMPDWERRRRALNKYLGVLIGD